jgi:hypothetical protein
LTRNGFRTTNTGRFQFGGAVGRFAVKSEDHPNPQTFGTLKVVISKTIYIRPSCCAISHLYTGRSGVMWTFDDMLKMVNHEADHPSGEQYSNHIRVNTGRIWQVK